MRDEGAYPVGPAVDENSYAHSRAFGRNFGAAFGATLYRDFVRRSFYNVQMWKVDIYA
jgi:hypothetical protein